MDGKKVFLVVLALLAALFAVGVIFGAVRHDEPEDEQREPRTFEKTLGGLVGSLKPKARLSAREFAGGTSTSVGGSDQAMRMVKFRIVKPCRMTISYKRAPALKPSDLDDQPWNPDDKEIKDKESTSFVILKEGGTITFGTCANKGHACKAFVVEE
jgi:hypothetical protein